MARNDAARKADIAQDTKETRTRITLNLDGKGVSTVNTGIAYFDHMLEQFAFHGLFDLKVTCKGDLKVDSHHTVEDVGLALGKAIDKALGDRSRIRRFSHCYYPMDETLVRAVMDLSGRPEFHFQGEFRYAKVGALDSHMIPHFFKSLAITARLTLHLAILYGENDHHKCEGLFKAFTRALRDAVARDPRRGGVVSTKGIL